MYLVLQIDGISTTIKFPFVQSSNHVACHLEEIYIYGSIPERNHRLAAKGGGDQYVFTNGFNYNCANMIISSPLRASLTIQHF